MNKLTKRKTFVKQTKVRVNYTKKNIKQILFPSKEKGKFNIELIGAKCKRKKHLLM